MLLMGVQVGICTNEGRLQASDFTSGFFAGETMRGDLLSAGAPIFQSVLAGVEQVLIVHAKRGLERMLCVHHILLCQSIEHVTRQSLTNENAIVDDSLLTGPSTQVRNARQLDIVIITNSGRIVLDVSVEFAFRGADQSAAARRLEKRKRFTKQGEFVTISVYPLGKPLVGRTRYSG